MSEPLTGAITRHFPDGTLDLAFAFSREYKDVRAAAAAPDGKLFVSAVRYSYGDGREMILRLHADGSIDSAFAPVEVGPASLPVWTLTVLPDGKLLVAGYFESFNDSGRRCIARLLPDGSVDPSFVPPQFTATSLIPSINAPPRVLPDGKILVAGNFTAINGSPNPGVARLHADGSLDPTFQPSGITRVFNAPIRGLIVEENGSIVIGGRFQFGSFPARTYAPLMRLLPDGGADSTFTPLSHLTSVLVLRDLAVQSDGKLVAVAGNSVYRFLPDGPMDSTFRQPVFRSGLFLNETDGTAFGIQCQLDDRLLIAGPFTLIDEPNVTPERHERFSVARLNGDGTVDTTFTTPFRTAREAPAGSFGRMPDGSTIVSVATEKQPRVFPDNPVNIMRLLPDGMFDPTFSVTSPRWNEMVAAGFEVMEDGALFTHGGTADYLHYVKLLPDGAADPRFALDPATAPFLQARRAGDNGVLLAPDNDAQTTLDSSLAKLRSNGLLDPSFALAPAIRNAQVERDQWQLPIKVAAGLRVLAVQPDAKILVAYLGLDSLVHLRRLLPTGEIDTGFAAPAFTPQDVTLTFPLLFDRVTGVMLFPAEGVLQSNLPLLDALVQADDRIIIVGQFASFGGGPARGVVRLNADGSVDHTFAAGGGAQWASTIERPDFFPFVEAIAQQNDGRLLLVGTFEAFNGAPAPGIISLHSNGSVDKTFTPPAVRQKTSTMRSTLRRQADGSLLLSGPYSFPGETESQLLRIVNLGGVPIIGSGGIATAVPGRAFRYDIGASGQPTSYSASGLPGGFSFDPATGVITGTPTDAQIGTYPVSLTATNGEGTSAPKVLQLTVLAPVTVESATSRKDHGTAGTFDLALPLSRSAGVECRTGGSDGSHTIVFRFANPLLRAPDVSVTSGSGSGIVTSATLGGDSREYVVQLSGVPNAQEITVALHDAADEAGNYSPQLSVRMAVLLGDTNGSGLVNASDVGQTKAHSGGVVTQANFRADVNASGAINASDIALVKANSGSQVQTDAEVSSRAAR